MTHWYLTAPKTVERIEEDLADPGPGEALVRIAYTTLSPGSNVFVYRAGSYDGRPNDRQDLLYMGSGVVEALGEGVTEVAPGDRVIVTTGHQDRVVVPAARLHRVPDGLTLRDAAISYLCAWAVGVLHRGRYEAAEAIVVVGLGLVGASAALVAELMGARVIGLDVDDRRIAFGSALGLGAVARPGDAAVSEFLGERGADIVIETTGAWQGFKTAIDLARDFTRIPVMGIYREPPPPDLGLAVFDRLFAFPSTFHYRRLEIIGCGSDPEVVTTPAPRHATGRSNHAYVLEQAARGRLPLDRLVTDVLAPDDIGAALERMDGGDASMVGVVFDWTGEAGS